METDYEHKKRDRKRTKKYGDVSSGSESDYRPNSDEGDEIDDDDDLGDIEEEEEEGERPVSRKRKRVSSKGKQDKSKKKAKKADLIPPNEDEIRKKVQSMMLEVHNRKSITKSSNKENVKIVKSDQRGRNDNSKEKSTMKPLRDSLNKGVYLIHSVYNSLSRKLFITLCHFSFNL